LGVKARGEENRYKTEMGGLMKPWLKKAMSLVTAAALVAPVLSMSSLGAASSASAATPIKVGVALTYNNTAFWAAYIQYEQQYAKQMGITLLGPLLAGTNASLQNRQMEDLVNEGAQAIIVNPETAVSMGPALTYAAAHHVGVVSVDTIVGVGHVYMVVRASNLFYGYAACAYLKEQGITSGVVVDNEGDLTSSNGADRTNAFNDCMAKNDPGVTIKKIPTVWVASAAVKAAEDAVNAYGTQVKAIYDQYSGPDLGIIPFLKSKGFGPAGSAKHVDVISDDGVAFEMCWIGQGWVNASSSQPANLYAQGALTYAKDAATGVVAKAGQMGVGATLAPITYRGDTNMGDPIVAPFVTKTKINFSLTPVDGQPAAFTSTPVSNAALWGNVYGKAHGGVCSPGMISA
jgi:ABC-type sugar transport system substrate-binding protein